MTIRTSQGFHLAPRFPVGAIVSACLIAGTVAALLALAVAGVGLVEW